MAIAKKEYEFSSWEKVYEDWFKKEIGPLFDKYLEKVRKEYQDKKMLYKEEDIYYEAYQRTYVLNPRKYFYLFLKECENSILSLKSFSCG